MQTPPRILIIDDNPDDRALLIHQLRRVIPEAVILEIGDAVSFANAFDIFFDLVITDYNLRWTNGFEILRRVKRLHPNCPVVMFTAAANEELAARATKEGLDYHVPKIPANYERVALTARSALEAVATAARASQLERRFQALLDRLNVGVFRTNSDGLLLEANHAFLKLIGWSEMPSDIYLRELYLHPEMQAHHLHKLQQHGSLHEYEVELCRADGSPVLVSLSQTLSEAPGGEMAIDTIVEDISLRVKLDAQIRETQKLESIGRLAAGVAHDFNNILTIIQGHTALLLLQHNFDTDTAFSLKSVISAAERAATLTRQLLAFSRKQNMRVQSVDLSLFIEHLSGLIQHVVGDKVLVTFNCASPIPRVSGDESMLQQMLLSIALNARDAMPAGGTLAIETRSAQINESDVRHNLEARTGTFVCVSLTDTGAGIAPQHLRHIFEPFFTTKPFGKGAGLGLAAVYGMVQQHKGWIEVESRIGHGTTFRIYLPSETKKAVVPAQTPPPPADGHETVLLVEDEVELLGLVSAILQGSGYRVIPATSGNKAIEAWRQSPHEIDLLVTDMKMPDGLGGAELAQQLVAANPQLKVLYTSGFSPGSDPGVSLKEGDNYLQKPYSPERLLVMIRQILESPEAKR